VRPRPGVGALIMAKTRKAAPAPAVQDSSERLRAFRARHGGASQARASRWCRTPVRTWEGWENEHREPPPCLWALIDYIDRYGPPPDDETSGA
jgi:hypothetical protein